MISVLIVGFLAGFLVGGGVPLYIKGATGQKYMTPFGQTTTPTSNVVWAWLNFVVAALLWHIAPMRGHPRAAFAAVAVGVLVVGLMMGARAKSLK